MTSSTNDPLELLTVRADRKPRFLSAYFNPVGCAAAGFGIAIMLNWGLRKPLFSGIQKHMGFTAFGGLLGVYIDKKRTESLATRDAILRHYIQLHPEDFPVVERKKYGDILEAWIPIR